MEQPLLEISELFVSYKTDLETVYAVNGVSLAIKRGEMLGLVGETGAGKTTTALSIMGLLPERIGQITHGQIRFADEDLLALPEKRMDELRGDCIAMIFQDPMTSLNPVLTVGEQIGEAVMLHNPTKEKDEVEARVDEALSLVGISPQRKREYPHQFSGGMKQRVIIAMALACEPDLLIADEPTTALDVTLQAQVLSMIMDLRARLGTSMLLITHDLGVVAQTCDSVAIMYAGEIVEKGSIADVFSPGPHHPYTEGLFGSIPRLEEKCRRLRPIAGLMPDPTDLPAGCRFAPRCPHRTEQCIADRPILRGSGTHFLACHLIGGEEGQI